jgi:hypothetical protein
MTSVPPILIMSKSRFNAMFDAGTEIVEGDISFKQLYFCQFSYSVSAGLADFNVSYTENIDPIWASEMCVAHPQLSDMTSFPTPPLPKGQGQCVNPNTASTEWQACDESLFLPGGALATAPQVNLDNGYPEATLMVIPDTQGFQLEFGQVRDLQSLRYSTGMCAIMGNSSGAGFYCIAKGRPSEYFTGIILL